MTQEDYKLVGLPTDEEIEKYCKPDVAPIEIAQWMREKAFYAAYDTRYSVLEAAASAEMRALSMYGLAGYNRADFCDLIINLASKLRDIAEI